MKTIRGFALKSQFAVVAALLIAFAIGVSVLHGLRDQARPDSAALLAGPLLSALLAFALSRYVVRPISTLAEYAKHWRPGQPWDCEAPSVSPEINGLFERMKGLMQTINEEYRKERDMNRVKSQFVSLVSHELNNALSVIHAASANLEELDPNPKDEKREKMYRMIKGQIRSLSNAISNLLNAGRLESGRLALRKKKMEMQAVLRNSLELLEILYENKGLSVTLSLPDASVPVYADPDALTLVATNLLSNAIKYTPQGGAISVGIAREGGSGDFVRVYIQDTGIGIRPEERDRIFSGYYRSEAGQKLAKGFGIGLSLAKSIIEAHGGRLELESEPGKGSTFSFLLPVWQADLEAKRTEEEAGSAPTGGGN